MVTQGGICKVSITKNDQVFCISTREKIEIRTGISKGEQSGKRFEKVVDRGEPKDQRWISLHAGAVSFPEVPEFFLSSTSLQSRIEVLQFKRADWRLKILERLQEASDQSWAKMKNVKGAELGVEVDNEKEKEKDAAKRMRCQIMRGDGFQSVTVTFTATQMEISGEKFQKTIETASIRSVLPTFQRLPQKYLLQVFIGDASESEFFAFTDNKSQKTMQTIVENVICDYICSSTRSSHGESMWSVSSEGVVRWHCLAEMSEESKYEKRVNPGASRGLLVDGHFESIDCGVKRSVWAVNQVGALYSLSTHYDPLSARETEHEFKATDQVTLKMFEYQKHAIFRGFITFQGSQKRISAWMCDGKPCPPSFSSLPSSQWSWIDSTWQLEEEAWKYANDIDGVYLSSEKEQGKARRRIWTRRAHFESNKSPWCHVEAPPIQCVRVGKRESTDGNIIVIALTTDGHILKRNGVDKEHFRGDSWTQVITDFPISSIHLQWEDMKLWCVTTDALIISDWANLTVDLAPIIQYFKQPIGKHIELTGYCDILYARIKNILFRIDTKHETISDAYPMDNLQQAVVNSQGSICVRGANITINAMAGGRPAAGCCCFLNNVRFPVLLLVTFSVAALYSTILVFHLTSILDPEVEWRPVPGLDTLHGSSYKGFDRFKRELTEPKIPSKVVRFDESVEEDDGHPILPPTVKPVPVTTTQAPTTRKTEKPVPIFITNRPETTTERAEKATTENDVVAREVERTLKKLKDAEDGKLEPVPQKVADETFKKPSEPLTLRIRRGLLYAAPGIGAIIGSFLMINLSKKFGIQKLFSGSLAASSLLTIVFLYVQKRSYALLLVVRLLQGLLFSSVFPVIGSVLVQWGPLKEQLLFLTAMLMFVSVGPVVAWPVASYFHALELEFDYGFYVQSLILALFALTWGIFYRDRPQIHPWVSGVELNRIVAGKVQELQSNRAPSDSFTSLFRSLAAWSILISVFGFFSVIAFFGIYLPSFLASPDVFIVEGLGIHASIPFQLLPISCAIFASLNLLFKPSTKIIRILNALAFVLAAVFIVAIPFIAFLEKKAALLSLLLLSTIPLGLAIVAGFARSLTVVGRVFAEQIVTMCALPFGIAFTVIPIVVTCWVGENKLAEWTKVVLVLCFILFAVAIEFAAFGRGRSPSWAESSWDPLVASTKMQSLALIDFNQDECGLKRLNDKIREKLAILGTCKCGTEMCKSEKQV
ncbi:unnamed protein product [Caenorhabditis sp. 36 PRJEB53466]|nr:unnamed protein product [Caenorhabditis sp. 36 PRJEB53466]